MRLTSFALLALMVTGTTATTLADSMMSASPKASPMHAMMKNTMTKKSPKPKASGAMMKSDHMMGSPKPKASAKP